MDSITDQLLSQKNLNESSRSGLRATVFVILDNEFALKMIFKAKHLSIITGGPPA